VAPAAVADGPALALTVTICEGLNVNVHWSPAGWLPAAEVRERLSVTVPPGATAPEDSARES